ncbi:MAG: lipid-A-disaccharide synthase [Bacteroidia bacterium]
MKYYIIAGEASGDLHASNLLKEIRRLDADAVFRGWGGDLMQEQGVTIVKHYRDLAFMGFVEVLMNLRTILKNIDIAKADIATWKPDAVILVDYPGFNLRIAEYVKSLGIKVFYYISPQVWAWKESRVHKIKRAVDRMFCILPFEKDFYARHQFDVDYVGHPLLDAIDQFKTGHAVTDDGRKIIALLPGSRRQEIRTMLPVMMQCASKFPQYRFIIAGAPSQPESFYKELLGEQKAEIVFGKTYALLSQSHAALVTSGTATLETALFNVPEVVCYKGSAISYAIAKRLVKVKYISLVNLIMDREVVKELIQHDMNADTVSLELSKISEEGSYRSQMIEDYKSLHHLLRKGKSASLVTAEKMIAYLKK